MQPIPAQDITPSATAPPRGRLYVRESKGRFQRLRRALNGVLMTAFLLLPWLSWRGQALVWLDIAGREFHLFGATFHPQEFVVLALAFIAAAFGLFAVTALAGRVWCGYTCPQSVWSFAFMWVEHRLEGARHRRLRRDRNPTAAHRLRKVLKHALWLAMALGTAVTVVGYFTPIEALLVDLVTLEVGGWALFWVGFFTLFTYLNAGWLREQVCLYMCPYARFQAVMYERDTLIVAYDAARGEPRDDATGDCVDCQVCVQVCPTGIDIRDGLQYACLQCGACVDACDAVMTRLDRPTGLVGYTTQSRLEGRAGRRLRPRLLGYLGALAVVLVALVALLGQRVPVSFEVERPRASLYTTTDAGEIRNVYRLTVRNLDTSAHRFRLSATGIAGARLDVRAIDVPAGESRSQVVNVTAPAEGLAPSQPLSLRLSAEQGDLHAERETRFLGGKRR